MPLSLKNLIKELIRQKLKENGGGSTTGGSGTGNMGGGQGMNYATPRAFTKKGQKSNKATKEAEKLGFEMVKTGIPSDSKVKDYKELWKSSKKPKYKIYQESDYDKASPSQNPSPYDKPSGYTGGSIKGDGYYKRDSMSVQESIKNIIKQELLNEVTYKQFKTEVKFRTKAEMLHKAMREVKKKLNEIDRLVDYTTRMKQELHENDKSVKYWKATETNIAKISEMVNHLNNKIKNLHQ